MAFALDFTHIIIDGVYQLLCQLPNWFEFNEAYLMAILDEVSLTQCAFLTFSYIVEGSVPS